MSVSKPLPFARVRVMVDTGEGLCLRPDARRAWASARRGAELAWRMPAEAATPPADDRPDDPADAAGDPAGTVGRDRTGAAARPPLQVAPHGDEAPQRRPAAPREMPEPQPHTASRPDPMPPALPPAGLPGMAVPVAAIARAVEEAEAVQLLTALVVETCSGEGKRETGPWEFTLPLNAHGLGGSTLCLQLSQRLLSLRFHCDGRDARDVLSRHRGTLQQQLQEQMRPPLEVEVLLVDA
jgi:hypothetical protein